MSAEPTPAEPVLSHRSERSVLDDPAGLQPFAVNGRKRLATCSGVSWFHHHHLAVANLYGSHVRIYRFDPAAARLELLHELREGISYPEDVAVSPDGRWLAVTHSLSESARLSLHRLEEGSLRPVPGGETVRPGRTFHGVRFTPDSRHLAFTDIGSPGYVEVVRTGSWETTTRLENLHAPLKPKCAAFSADGLFAAIAGAPNASQREGSAPATGSLALHRFDARTGAIAADPLCRLSGPDAPLVNPEMCTFLPSSSSGDPSRRILIADQAQDAVLEIAFEAGPATLRFTGTFAADLSFPHGIDASADGRFVAITSYGDDTLRICRILP